MSFLKNNLTDPSFSKRFLELVKEFLEIIKEKDNFEELIKQDPEAISNDKENKTLTGFIMNHCRSTTEWKKMMDLGNQNKLNETEKKYIENIYNKYEELLKIWNQILCRHNFSNKIITIYSCLNSFDESLKEFPYQLSCSFIPIWTHLDTLLCVKTRISNIIPIMHIGTKISLEIYGAQDSFHNELEVVIPRFSKFTVNSIMNNQKYTQSTSENMKKYTLEWSTKFLELEEDRKFLEEQMNKMFQESLYWFVFEESLEKRFKLSYGLNLLEKIARYGNTEKFYMNIKDIDNYYNYKKQKMLEKCLRKEDDVFESKKFIRLTIKN